MQMPRFTKPNNKAVIEPANTKYPAETHLRRHIKARLRLKIYGRELLIGTTLPFLATPALADADLALLLLAAERAFLATGFSTFGMALLLLDLSFRAGLALAFGLLATARLSACLAFAAANNSLNDFSTQSR